MADTTIDIQKIVEPFTNTEHIWTGKNDFSDPNNQSVVRTLQVNDKSKNAASTQFVVNKINTVNPSVEQNSINVPLLTPMMLDYTIEDENWILSSSSNWTHNNGIISNLEYTKDSYLEIYNHLISDCEEAEEKTIIINNIECKYKLAKDGHKIIPNTNDYKPGISFENIYNDNRYLSFWFFILDENNEKFGLPKSKSWFRLTDNDISGEMIKSGLPNIKGSITMYGRMSFANASGALATESQSFGKIYSDEGGVQNSVYKSINFDASRCSNLYSDDITTVTVPSVSMYLYFSTRNPSDGSQTNIRNYNTGIVDGNVNYSYSINPLENGTNSEYKKFYTLKTTSFVNLQVTDCSCTVNVWVNKEYDTNFYVGCLNTIDDVSKSGVLSVGYLPVGTTIWLDINPKSNLTDTNSNPSLTIFEYGLNLGTNDSIGRIGNSSIYNTKISSSTSLSVSGNCLLVIDAHGQTPSDFYVKLDNETVLSPNMTYQAVISYPLAAGTKVEWTKNYSTDFECVLYKYDYKSNHTDCQSYITSSYTSDKNVRVDLYSDGWCEQRGRIQYPATTTYASLTAGFNVEFDVAFSGEPYYIGVTTSLTPTITSNYSKLCTYIKSISTTGFTYTLGLSAESGFTTYANNSYYDYWEAYGYVK